MMNPGFNAFEIINVVIVVLLFAALIRKRDAAMLLIVLFAYGTLHFGFAAMTLTASESAHLLIALHNEGGGMLAKLSTLALLGVVFVMLGRAAYGAARFSEGRDKIIFSHIALVMAAILLGYASNIRDGDWLQLKNVISLETMLAFLMVGYGASNNTHSLTPEKFYSWWLGGLCVLGFADCIAIYEVFYHQSWAGTMQSSGDMVYRASSILFNPNLLGYWASLVYLGCAYGMHVYKGHRTIMAIGLILASVAIYFSGSRSAGYLLLAVMFIPALLIWERLHWLPLLVLPSVMLTLYAGATLVAEFLVADNEGWHEISLLGLRFYAAVPSLLYYLTGKLEFVMDQFDFSKEILTFISIPGGIPDAPSEIVESIEGRFVGEGRDSGWMVLYQDSDLLGVGAVFLGACILLIWGVRVYVAQPNATSAYALAILVYSLLTGIVMRLQIFPVWLFTAIVLIHCIVYWRGIPLKPIFRKN